MKDESQHFYISVESLRNPITSRLIPLFSLALLITMFLSRKNSKYGISTLHDRATYQELLRITEP